MFGAQTFGDAIEPEVIGRMAEARVGFVRLPLQWQHVEPARFDPPIYDFKGPDQAVAVVAAPGFGVILLLFGRPDWAASTTCGPIDRVPLARYAAYVSALAERYDGDGVADAPGSPRVAYWEIENEPDFDPVQAVGADSHGSCFGGGGAAAYADQLRAAYGAIKAADPTATVLFGGLAYDRLYNKGGYSPTGPFDYVFARSVITSLTERFGAEPGWPFFDWMALHVYNDFRNNWDGIQPYRQELAAKLDHFRRNELVRPGVYDLRARPIALTEASLASLPGDAFTTRSEALQAVYPGQLLARAMAAGVPAVTWFTMEDRFTGPCDKPYDWLAVGLLRSLAVHRASRACGPANPIPSYQVTVDHEPKPAFQAFRAAQEALGKTIFDRPLTSAETGSAQIEAYRVYRPGEGYRIVAFTDNGERVGRAGSVPLTRQMRFNAGILPGWTGRVVVTDHLGVETRFEGGTLNLPITEAPKYVRPAPPE